MTASPPFKSSNPSFFAELKRRKVVRVAITYAVVVWLIIQIASATFGWFDIPAWAFRFVTLMLILGFPVALIITWAFELTPDGVKLTKNVSEEQKAEVPQARRNWLALGFAAALPTVIFGILAIFFYFKVKRVASDMQEIVAERQISLEKSIAVLPLANMSPDPENAFFADGVHEDILANLSRIEELFVISRTSTLGYRNTTKNLRDIGQELGVRYLVEGSVRRAGGQVRVTVQLINAQSDEHLWAQNYDRGLDNIFAIQSEIAKEIAGQLKAAISPEEIAEIDRRPTENQQAYDAYMKCRQLIEESPHTGLQKIALLEKAVSLDPEFAEAWALLANEATFWWYFGERRADPALLEKSKRAIEMAERLAPESATLLYAKSQLRFRESRDIEGSIDIMLEALELDSNNFFVKWGLATCYAEIGRYSESTHFLESMVRADPFSIRVNDFLIANCIVTKSWDRARSRIQVNLERTNHDPHWLFWLAQVNFIESEDFDAFQNELKRIPGFEETQHGKLWSSLQARNYHAALEELKGYEPTKDVGLFYEWDRLAFVSADLLSAIIYFELGEEENSKERANLVIGELENIVERSPIGDPFYLSNLAMAYALEGSVDAFERTISKVRELTAQTNWRLGYQTECETHIAIGYLVLGNNAKAIELLEDAVQMDGQISLRREIQMWFIFDRLRGNPRFDALLESQSL